ncbi:MAG: N-acetylmuramoyl-L-alanine amidase [Hyphomicrobiaceae bacterium]
MRSYNRATTLFRVGRWAFLIVVWAVVQVMATGIVTVRAEQGAGAAWGGSTEVRLAPSGPDAARERPRADRAAKAERPSRTKQASTKLVVAAPGPMNAILGYALEGDGQRTVLSFDLGGPTAVSARSLANPPRVIVDLPETEFQLPQGAGQEGRGLVRVFRYGLIEAGKSRIVIDTAGPVMVDRAEVMLADAKGAFRLEIEISPTTAQQLVAAELAEAALNITPTPLPEPEPAPRPVPVSHRPVIVVDAGHGGIDPGASGAHIAEKDLVLSVAQHIEKALKAARGYDVVMTRTSDVFIALDERVAIAHRHNADLFVSVHADSIPGLEAAKHVRGATVYTLAEHASDDLTRRVADKENSADLLAGLPASTVADDMVRGILLDLMWRETKGYATEFREALLKELRSSVLLSRDPRRSGPFRVLRNPSSPAVLVELGYISNAEDERIMMRADWQSKVAAGVVRAVDEHFRRRLAARR